MSRRSIFGSMLPVPAPAPIVERPETPEGIYTEFTTVDERRQWREAFEAHDKRKTGESSSRPPNPEPATAPAWHSVVHCVIGGSVFTAGRCAIPHLRVAL